METARKGNRRQARMPALRSYSSEFGLRRCGQGAKEAIHREPKEIEPGGVNAMLRMVPRSHPNSVAQWRQSWQNARTCGASTCKAPAKVLLRRGHALKSPSCYPFMR